MVQSHLEDAHKLEGDGYVDLFEIHLVDGSRVYLKANNTATWQGVEYEGLGIKITGVGNSGDDENTRPQLSVVNPMGIFSASVARHELDRAIVVRKRVLYQDFINDHPVFRQQMWTIGRVASANKNMVSFELRDMLDGQHFIVPARMFMPPNFPMVSLT